MDYLTNWKKWSPTYWFRYAWHLSTFPTNYVYFIRTLVQISKAISLNRIETNWIHHRNRFVEGPDTISVYFVRLLYEMGHSSINRLSNVFPVPIRKKKRVPLTNFNVVTRAPTFLSRLRFRVIGELGAEKINCCAALGDLVMLFGPVARTRESRPRMFAAYREHTTCRSRASRELIIENAAE